MTRMRRGHKECMRTVARVRCGAVRCGKVPPPPHPPALTLTQSIQVKISLMVSSGLQ